MKIRRILSLLLVGILVLSVLSACGAGSTVLDMGAGAEANRAPTSAAGDGLSKTDPSGDTSMPANQKLIRKVYIDAETEDMDALLGNVEQRTGEMGGYIESREIYNGSNRDRYASVTIRIPAQKLDQFVEHVTGNSNITSLRETTEDITLNYVATESRVKALEAEETRLLELLAMAENMEDLLLIESKLTDVRTELEQVKSILRVYDNQVSYSTVYLEIYEVKEYTETQTPDGFFARIGNGFVKSLKSLWNFILELIIFLVICLPYLAFIAVIVLAIVLPIKFHNKKKKKQNKE